MKKFFLVLFLILLLTGAFLAWNVLMPNTNVDDSAKYLYIRSGKATKEEVMKIIRDSNLLKSPGTFEFVAGKMEVWERLKPGKYELTEGTSVLDLVRKLRNGSQSTVNLTITKIRTKEQLSSLIGKRFETDSATMMAYLTSPDSLNNFGLDTNTVMAAVFPDTYTYNWTSSPSVIFSKLHDQYIKIWNEDRKSRATALGLNTIKAYTLASIIEEETNIEEDKPLMASVYINRLNKGMRLGADPTVKFALKDFELRRIYQKHLQTNSPYNTYRYVGLPPGPICTPSLKTLDAVLSAPQTDYLYFVAKSDFSQKHVFTTNYADHLKYAKEYQQALNLLQERKNVKEETGN